MPVPASRITLTAECPAPSPEDVSPIGLQLELERLIAQTFRVTGKDPLRSAPLLRCGLRGAAMECVAAVRLAAMTPSATAVRELGVARGALGAYRRVLYVALRNDLISNPRFDALHAQVHRIGVALAGAQRARLVPERAPAPAPDPRTPRGRPR